MRAITVGSALIDVIAQINPSAIEKVAFSNATTSYLLLEPGRKIEASHIKSHIGGGAFNVAVALQRLGFEAAPLVKLGADINAEEVRAAMHEQGLSQTLVKTSASFNTGISVLVSAHDRNAAIFTYRGANTDLKPGDYQVQDFAGVDLVYISNLSNESADCFPSIAAMARQAGAKVAVNPGIRQLSTRIQDFVKTLSQVDLLTMNATEALEAMSAIYASSDTTPYSNLPAPEGLSQARLWRSGLQKESLQLPLSEFMARLRAHGVGAVCITDGTYGSYLADSEGLHFCPSLKVRVESTVGAGDAFAATLSSCVLRALPVRQALALASLNSAAVVGELNAQSGLLEMATLQQRYEQLGEQLTVTSANW